jgi:hypothetical protein
MPIIKKPIDDIIAIIVPILVAIANASLNSILYNVRKIIFCDAPPTPIRVAMHELNVVIKGKEIF